MKKWYVVTLAMLTGIGLGAFSVEALTAPATGPVYYIGEVQVTNPTGYMRDFVPKSHSDIKADGGTLLAAGGTVTPLIGVTPPHRIVVMRWQSMAALNKWFHSPQQQEAFRIQQKYAKVQAFVVNGLPR